MDSHNLFIGCVFSAIFIMCALWHIRENTRLEQQLQKKTDKNTSQWLVQFAWSRTFQLLAALGCSIVLIMSYDRRLNEARDDIDVLIKRVEQKEKVQRQLAQPKQPAITTAPHTPVTPPGQLMPAANISPAVSPPAIATATPPPVTNQSNTQQLAKNTNGDKTPANALQNSSPPPTANETIDALYNPERGLNDRQSSMDDIKRRYEDILVIHMFLKRCSRVQPTDYDTILSALSQEMAAVDAPRRLQYDILTSAQGSYKEIYEKSPCDGKGIADLYSQYTNYIKLLATDFPAPKTKP